MQRLHVTSSPIAHVQMKELLSVWTPRQLQTTAADGAIGLYFRPEVPLCRSPELEIGQQIGSVQRGDTRCRFGEMSLLDGAPRAAAIRAVGEVTTMMISRGAFTKLRRREPQIAEVLLRTLATRLRAAQGQY
jgi:hypothetical protein